MPNIVDANYSQTGQSTSINNMGMREMQQKAFEARNNQYILLKAPPASGKSRALMFLGLDKLKNQKIKKVIVTVPERSIGGSFKTTDLKSHGFFADWIVKDENNLCTSAGDQSKVKAFVKFLSNDDEILICTHSTLRYAVEQIEEEKFNNTLLAIDEFHHVSMSEDSRLGSLIKDIMAKSNAHIIAMTGSYFRGDSVPVLAPEDEEKFSRVTYNYYEQLNGYTYLKSLGIGYHFYQGRYLSAISEVLDTNKKTILHIPSVNAGESTKDKYEEVSTILESVGEWVKQDQNTGVIFLKRHLDGKEIKVADLVHDDQKERDKIVTYLRNIEKPEDMDLIIALGMAKEGFDWAFCEHALTVGYRGSLTEIIQIIGRCTRDSSNKTHAQFTNLVAEPDAKNTEVADAVNNMLKAITCSLLMEQVLAPRFKFKSLDPGEKPTPGVLNIKGLKNPKTKLGKSILENDMNDLKAIILQNEEVRKAIAGLADPQYIKDEVVPRIIREKYPSLDEDDVQAIAQHNHVGSILPGLPTKEEGNQKFIQMAGKFLNIEELEIDLIETINPFQMAYEILSKSVDKEILKSIQQAITLKNTKMTLEEAKYFFPKITEFFEAHGKEPDVNSPDPIEIMLARALAYLKRAAAES